MNPASPGSPTSPGSPALAVHGLDAFYGHFQALHGVDLTLDREETLAVIGSNGAGKTTLLSAIMGQVSSGPEPGRVELFGEPLTGLSPPERVRRGVCLVPEGRRLFPSLSVQENLLVGAASGRSGPWTVDAVYDVFPGVAALRGRPVAGLSGGEQQAVAIGRGLMANPAVLLLDEVSLGLAPVVVERLYAALAQFTAAGLATVVIGQNVGQALGLAARVQCLRAGRTVLTAAVGDLTAAAVTDAYFRGGAA